MDPITIGLGIAGLGMSLFGGMGQASIAKQKSQFAQQEAGIEQQKAGVSGQITGIEGQENDVRRQAMEMSASRSQLQTLRTAQRARSMAVQSGVTNNASFGSGVAGGTAEATSEGYFGLQGIQNQLGFGRQMFGYDSQITAKRIQMSQLSGQEAGLQGQSAALGGQEAIDQGISSLGGALLKTAPMIGNIFGGGKGPTGTATGGFNPFNVTGSLY